MSSKRIDPRILKRIIFNPKIDISKQAVKNAISQIRRDNSGVTLNAAAIEFARRRGIFLFRYLNEDDRKSLQYLVTKPLTRTQIAKPTRKERKSKEIKIDFKSNYSKGAKDNMEAYFHLFILENSLREVIFEKFGKDIEWWNDKNVPKGVQEYVEYIKNREKEYPWIPSRGTHPIFYVGLLELFKIIEVNWQHHFKNIFKDLELLRSWIKEIIPIRNMIAHNIKLRNKEKVRIETNTDYICRLIEKRNQN
jgi:hypothetical protein